MEPEVAIIGGGAIGVVLRPGAGPPGSERHAPGARPELASGCSAGSAGLICPSHSTPISNPVSLRNGLRWLCM